MVIHMSCFLPPEPWILNSWTETCLPFRAGSVINLNPSSYFDVCPSLPGVNTDRVAEYCLCCAGLDQLISETTTFLILPQLSSAMPRWRDYRLRFPLSLISLFSHLIFFSNKKHVSESLRLWESLDIFNTDMAETAERLLQVHWLSDMHSEIV